MQPYYFEVQIGNIWSVWCMVWNFVCAGQYQYEALQSLQTNPQNICHMKFQNLSGPLMLSKFWNDISTCHFELSEASIQPTPSNIPHKNSFNSNIINQALRKQANSNIRTRVEKSKELGEIVVNEFESILTRRSASSTLSGKQTA